MKCLIIFASLSLLIAKVYSQSCQCGIEKTDGRIVGGTPVTSISKMPWMAMITDSYGFQYCGGAIIASRTILTAAHCMVGERASNVKVVTGVLQQSSSSNRRRMLNVRQIVSHPEYDNDVVVNDIALLFLENDIDLTQTPPVCIPTRRQTYDTLCVAGWGDTKDGSNQGSRDLLEVCFNENDFNTCNRRWGYSLNANTQITAGADGKDSCQGDSGGPLYTRISGRSNQVGIVSFGAKCGESCAVYTRVSAFSSWIQSEIDKNGGGYRCQ